MRFRVGPWVYRVVLLAETFYDEQGQPLDGQCLWRERKIVLAASLRRDLRLEVLLHELRHAWVYHFGNPSELEAHCDSVASFTADAMRQLLRQGGEATLVTMRPDNRRRIVEARRLE